MYDNTRESLFAWKNSKQFVCIGGLQTLPSACFHSRALLNSHLVLVVRNSSRHLKVVFQSTFHSYQTAGSNPNKVRGREGNERKLVLPPHHGFDPGILLLVDRPLGFLARWSSIAGLHLGCYEIKDSQTSRKWTPLGPSVAVRVREVSVYERLKNTKHCSGLGVSVMSFNHCFRLVHVKFLLTHKKKYLS